MISMGSNWFEFPVLCHLYVRPTGGLEVILQLSQIYDHKSKLLRMWEGMWLSTEQARKLSK